MDHDFYEGVRAVIVDKDNQPRWQPATLAAVSEAEVERHFAPLGGGELVAAMIEPIVQRRPAQRSSRCTSRRRAATSAAGRGGWCCSCA